MYPDFDTIERARQCLRDVWAYRRVDHIPVFIRISDKLGYSRRDILEDPELQYQINQHNIGRSLRALADDYIPYARVWLGYMTIATMFGLPVHRGDEPDQSPGIEHALIDDLEMVCSLAKPDARADGLMPDNLSLLRMFLERFPEWIHFNGINCSYRYTRDDLPQLCKAFAGKGLVQAMFDNGESAQEMLDGFRYMMEILASETVGLPVPIVDDTWSDAEITELYYEMREIGAEYATIMHWRDGGEVL